MPRKRRKLNKELELEISTAFKKVELITAKINDIYDDDTQSEYRTAFDSVKGTFLLLATLYESEGFTDQTNQLLLQYQSFLTKFEEEYEI